HPRSSDWRGRGHQYPDGILYQHGTCGSGLPQLVTVRTVIGAGVERSADVREGAGGGTRGTRVDVLGQHGAVGGAAARPQLHSMHAGVGGEVACATDAGQLIREVAEVGASGARVDVLDQHGAVGGAVALPQFKSVYAVVRGEEEDVVRGNKVQGVRAGG